MSPRDLRPAPVRSRLDEMRALLGDLDALGEVSDERLRGSVGLRNAIVHEYADVDLTIVAAAVPVARQEDARYVRSVAAWITGAGLAG